MQSVVRSSMSSSQLRFYLLHRVPHIPLQESAPTLPPSKNNLLAMLITNILMSEILHFAMEIPVLYIINLLSISLLC